MTKARILAQVVSAGNVLADGQIELAELGLENVSNTADSNKQVLSAATWTTARTLNYSGDAVGSSSVDGSQDVTTTLTLSTSGVTAGTYGSATNIPQVTVDAKGRVTAVTDVAVSIPSGSLTFTGDVSGSGSTGSSTALTLAAIGTSGTYTKITTDSKGRVTSGTTLTATDIPNLDAAKITSGTLDAARLPSYVDDVLEYAALASFPVTGETGKIYVALDTNKTYRWSGSSYTYITSGAVDSVAGKTGVVTLASSDVGLGSVENKSSATIRSEITSSNVTTALGFTPYNSTNPSGYITSSALAPYQLASTAITTSNIGSQSVNYATTAGSATNSTNSSYLTNMGYGNGNHTWYQTSGNWQTWTGGWASHIVSNHGDGATYYNQIITMPFWGAPQYMRKEGGVDKGPWTFITTENQTTYTPTLTGTGASGTWGINISGNAATATSATDSTKLPLAGGNLTGGLKEARVAMGANNIDLATGNYFTKTISGATSLTVSNVPAAGTAASFILDLTNGGSATITWWSGMKWAGGTAPTLTASGRDVLGFFTHDGGTIWTGLVLGKDAK